MEDQPEDTTVEEQPKDTTVEVKPEDMTAEVQPEDTKADEIPIDPEQAVINIVVEWINKTEPAPSKRQKLVSKIVKGRLNSVLKDYSQVEGMAAAIDSVSEKVSTWIDKVAGQADKEVEQATQKVC